MLGRDRDATPPTHNAKARRRLHSWLPMHVRLWGHARNVLDGGARRERALIFQAGGVAAAPKTGQREHLL